MPTTADPPWWRARAGRAPIPCRDGPAARRRSRPRSRHPVWCAPGCPRGPSDPRVNVVAFCRIVCTTTSRARVAIAIVDSVIRMMPPPKIAATTNAASADRAIAGSRPRSAVASASGRSGSCADFSEVGDRHHRGRVRADPHEGHVAERDDAAVADERLDRHHQHDVDEEHHVGPARGGRPERLHQHHAADQQQRDQGRPPERGPEPVAGDRKPHIASTFGPNRPCGRT